MFHYNFELRLQSSLIHTEETHSNMSNIFREKIKVDDKIHEIPALHGNAMRGLLRDIGAQHMLETVEFPAKELPTHVFHMLFTGGALTKSTSRLSVEEKREIRERLPLLSIFGTAMGNEMLQGKLIVSSVYPMCKELGNGEKSYNDMVQIVRYTRMDDIKKVYGEDFVAKQEEETSQMFYDIEVLVKGTDLTWEVYLDSDNDIERACFEQLLSDFIRKPYIGGASRAGHGKVSIENMTRNGEAFELDTDGYNDYLLENKKETVEKLKTL